MAKNMTRLALVTGAARRIGATIASYLHGEGYDVIIHFNKSEDSAVRLGEKLNAGRNGSASLVSGDLCCKDVRALIASQIEEKYGRLDLLVNNASVFYPTPIDSKTDSTPESDWDNLFDANAKAPYFLTLALRGALQKARGAVINISDIHAKKPLRDYAIYTASKAALEMLTLALAKELAPDIRVNAVAPGAILWPEKSAEISANTKDKIIEQTLLKRSGEPEDIAHAVASLANMPFVTGQILRVDGGRTVTHA